MFDPQSVWTKVWLLLKVIYENYISFVMLKKRIDGTLDVRA